MGVRDMMMAAADKAGLQERRVLDTDGNVVSIFQPKKDIIVGTRVVVGIPKDVIESIPEVKKIRDEVGLIQTLRITYCNKGAARVLVIFVPKETRP